MDFISKGNAHEFEFTRVMIFCTQSLDDISFNILPMDVH